MAMQVVKAYYDGKAFVPFGNVRFSPKQQAIIVFEDKVVEKNNSDAVLAFVKKYKGSINRNIDEKAELKSYRNEKYARAD